MKTRELSVGENQAILKLRESMENHSVTALTLAIASTTIWTEEERIHWCTQQPLSNW